MSKGGDKIIMAKLTKDEILSAVSGMTVLELSDLVKALEEKFGVSAAPVAVAGTAAPAADAGEPKEEQTVFNVVITEAGATKISVIKAVRELLPTLGLTDAKALVDAAPKEVLTGVNKSAAEEAKKKLEAAGAKVELK
ncbi:MAG: 50S ribosomal protein L7/L12 [Microgenomates group bacterium GW2011_GWB1_40_9]|nr:MAG: LSU ribosomal protein L12P [Microgenomates group bacterium GW2011_GWC1_39_12]KKR78969.1 MAG: 50S ribosomal protein L7/L12 [Microgenomates group bacterium GW2011_GWB1_40_9]